MANESIKSAAKQSGIKLWELAEYLGITDSTLSRKLRHEFPEAEAEKALAAIDEIARKKTEPAV